MVSYESGSYVLAGFLLVYAVLFMWVSYTSPPPEKRGVGALLQPKTVFALFALLYLALSHFTVFVGMGAGIDWGNRAPCENVVANSTAVSASITAYEYRDSCSGVTVPESVTALFTVYSWLLWIDLFALAIGMMLLFARMVSKW